MNVPNIPSQLEGINKNPFVKDMPFWGRNRELHTISSYLLSEPPQSCVIIGEAFIGKTALLHHLISPNREMVEDGAKDHLTFVYLDCASYMDFANSGEYASVQFWQDLYIKTYAALHAGETPSKIKSSPDVPLIQVAGDLRDKIENLIPKRARSVIIAFDNFEGVAGLPLWNSEWLRSLAQQRHCAYVVSSRYLLYLFFYRDSENNITPSPLWNLFSDPIYLGLMEEPEVLAFLTTASIEAKKCGSIWKEDDLDFIRQFAGRHPELLRIACKQLFEQRLQHPSSLQMERLKWSIDIEARSICNWLWQSLTDSQLLGIPRTTIARQETDMLTLSPHQQVLTAIAKEDAVTEIVIAKEFAVTEIEILFTLEQRGLIEQKDGKWSIFSEVMRLFVLKQEHSYGKAEAPETVHTVSGADEERAIPSGVERISTTRSFTYLEEQIYNYLQAHAGKICTHDEIKQAVWKSDLPSDSALQKIIERIRVKIETEPKNPRFLIAVRGQGYMLRNS